jgi:methionyl aminopeptidase
MIRIKTAEEIALLREGGKRHAAILRTLANEVKAGVSTNHINERAKVLIAEGADTSAFFGYQPYSASRPFPSHICVSLNDEVVHGIPNEAPRDFNNGDVVKLDLGLNHKGLITDGAVTLTVGDVSPEVQTLIDTAYQALDAGIAAARAGNTVGDIGAAIQAVIKPHGFGIVRELAGHGVGYSVHEDPYVPNYGTRGRGARLKPGMVLAIEPMITLGKGDIVLNPDGYTYRTEDGSIAVHVEHTIVVTEGDPEILTK